MTANRTRRLSPEGLTRGARGYRRSGPPSGEPPRRQQRHPAQAEQSSAAKAVTRNPYIHLTQTLLRGPLEPGQYTSGDYTQTLTDHVVLGSIGTVGDAYDKALVS